MLQASYHKYLLQFKTPGGTSRGVLTEKETWFLILKGDAGYGVGECAVFRGLSADDRPDYEAKLKWVCDHINLEMDEIHGELREFPSIWFGVEQALKSYQATTPFELFPSEYTKGRESIPINGLIWMGSSEFMKEQIRDRLEKGFACIKMKIGAIDFDSEYAILKEIRKEYTANEVELRVDANGAFAPEMALSVLEKLADLRIHSIEQPILAGQLQEMARLCELTPLAIALDEELIGIWDHQKKQDLLLTVKPQYIILKPSLVGGFSGSEDWIHISQKQGIPWWVTSALESNIGLNAIAQWTFTLNNKVPQGLGTGSLFTNNIEAPMSVQKGALHYHPEQFWAPDWLQQIEK